MDSTTNPYAPPQHVVDEKSPVARTPKRLLGPAIPISLGALLGGTLGLLVLQRGDTWKLAGVFAGSIAGALYFRIRSRRWPVDPTVPTRRIRYAGMAMLVPYTGAFLAAAAGQSVGTLLLLLVIGLSFTTAILISGDRRQKTESTENAP